MIDASATSNSPTPNLNPSTLSVATLDRWSVEVHASDLFKAGASYSCHMVDLRNSSNSYYRRCMRLVQRVNSSDDNAFGADFGLV